MNAKCLWLISKSIYNLKTLTKMKFCKHLQLQSKQGKRSSKQNTHKNININNKNKRRTAIDVTGINILMFHSIRMQEAVSYRTDVHFSCRFNQ